jgi:N-acetylglucosaminyl-diphospho-decaprenol L-rhamnosyltransferase
VKEENMRTQSILSIRPDLDIGVVYTHERDLMHRLLSSLAASGDGLRMRLLLIDNCSADGVEEYRRYFPDNVVIRNEKRLLYGANLNRAIRASTARYLLLLNTDMYFDPPSQCLARMVAFMDENSECGVSGCRLHHADGSFAYPARRFQTMSIIVARRLGLGRRMRKTLDRYLYREYAIEDSWACDWLSGCFLMLRREALNDVGSFDEGFVKYFEDVDMCLRMARAGWNVMYNGGAYGYHLEQRGSKRLFSADARRHLKSYLHWLWKWGFSPERHVAAAPAALRRAA